MITAQTELFSKIKPEMEAIFVKHHAEIGNFVDKMPLDPDYENYLAMERKGILQIVTVRDDGKLVGYYVGIVTGGLHYRSTLTNKMDIFYVDKSSRGGGAAVGKLLFDHVLRENLRRGVKFWRVGGKKGTPAVDFLQKIGFEPIEEHFALWLGE